ncbi:MAG: OmpH family outer membrane protein [Candidatus Ozemobacteraceae bacterium]
MKKNVWYWGLVAGLVAMPTVASALNFGFVDAGKLFNKYNETQKTKTVLEGEKVKLQQTLDAKKKEVADLDAKYAETAKKIMALRDGKKEKDAAALEPTLRSQREALANADNELKKFFEESQKRLYELEEEKMGSLSKVLDEKVDSVIKRVATAKNLEAVFEKRFCYFGGLDITDEVLAALNAEKAASEAPAAAPARKSGTK